MMKKIISCIKIKWKVKMKTITLYRPIGLKELELIVEVDFKGYPPRLSWQPIFYPVLNEQYAIEIATRWNLDDEGSGYAGFVTAFEIDEAYMAQFEVQNVGAAHHNELWVPAEKLDEFNAHIIGAIQITKSYYGDQFSYPDNEALCEILRKHET